MVALQVIIIVLALGQALGRPDKKYYDLEKAAEYFEDFIKEYKKKYSDEHEKEEKFKIFKMKLAEINRLNEENPDVVYGVTIFSDMTSEDFKNKFNTIPNISRRADSCEVYTDDVFATRTAPPSFDWTQKGIVTVAKNQINCGACWAFAATGAVESQYAIKHGKLVSLSEQQLVDCVPLTNCETGGNPGFAFSTLMDQGGQMLEHHYPYKDKQEECRYNHSKAFAVVSNCSQYNLKSVKAVKEALVQKGPLVVGIDATAASTFEHYRIGIVALCSFQINHNVLLVGYGEEKGVPYWIFKNSWGPTWGDSGHFRMRIIEDDEPCIGLQGIWGVEVA